MEQSDDSLSTIKSRLAKVRNQDPGLKIFGSEHHRYESKPESINDVEYFESSYAITLPAEYRRFLLEVGYGAGPYYGLFSLRRTEAEIHDLADFYSDEGSRELTAALSSEFPITLLEALEINQKVMAGDQAPHFATDYPFHGCMPICDQGCSFMAILVTVGELKGSVWDIDIVSSVESRFVPAKRPPALVGYGYRRVVLPHLSPLPTFLEWLIGWLDHCDADAPDVILRAAN